jgi:hypothetical protein
MGRICVGAFVLLTVLTHVHPKSACAQDPGPPPPPTNERPAQIGCAYVQYCDYPNHAAGTVCRTYPGCSITEETTADCEQDIETVCGDATAPVWFCNQSSTTCELPMTYQRFALDFDLQGLAGHAIETRVYWHGVSYIKLDKIDVHTVDRP